MMMKRLPLLPILLVAAAAQLPAAPVKWFLSQVTFSDGGRAVGSFVYDADTRLFSSINVQTTPGSATTSAASSIAGGTYTAGLAPSAPPPGGGPGPAPAVTFVSGALTSSTARVVNLLASNTLTNAGGTVPLTAGAVEGFCTATCTAVSSSSPTRSITAGAVVASAATAPVTWYLSGVFDDGGQIVGQFDIGSGGVITNIDVTTTGGTNLQAPARLRFIRPGSGVPQAILQTDLPAIAGSRVMVLNMGAVNLDGTVPFAGGIEGVCPQPSAASCPLENANPRQIVSGVATPVAPANFTRVISQIADGGGWQTGFILTNLTDRPAPYAISFFQDDGTPFAIGGIGSFTSGSVPARGVVFLNSASPANLTTGWGRVVGGNNVSVTTVFVWKNANAGGDQQGSVAGDAQGDVSLAVPYDNTNGSVSGLALVNTSASPITVLAIAYDETGRILATDSSLTLPGLGHTSFVLTARPGLAASANRKGLLRLFSVHGGLPPFNGLNGLLLKFLPNGAFTTIGVTNQ